MIRTLYYRRRTVHLPKIVVGTPELWTQTIAVSGKDNYNGLCTWSLCSRFIAAQTGKAVEIRNQLTLELITILQPTETIPHLTGPLAYSPDGRSIACASDAAIMVWDIQTGGVAKEIKCSPNNISLLWSQDGRTICTIDSKDQATFIVHVYDVSSGTASSPGKFESGDIPHLWTDDESFRVMTTVRDRHNHNIIDIFKVGSALTRIQSLSPRLSNAKIGSFSPATLRISTSTGNILRIFDIRNSQCLLEKTRHFVSHCFSSDGNYFAASWEGVVYVWKYACKWYTLLMEFGCQGLSNSLRFSPTSSSILGYSGDILRVWRLHEFPTAFETRRQYVGLSRSGNRVAAAHEDEKAVTIIDSLPAQTPPQIINTGVGIQGLVLTGNVLLVAGSNKLAAWLLTEEGLVDGVIGDRMVGHSDSIWAVPLPLPRGDSWMFSVEGQAGVIKQGGDLLHVYRTDTGEVLHPTQALQHFGGRWYHPTETLRGQDYLCYHDLSQSNTPPKDSWQISRAALREGWVKDPEGRHRLWMPVEWRTDWDPADWRHDVTTQFSRLGGRSVIIKF